MCGGGGGGKRSEIEERIRRRRGVMLSVHGENTKVLIFVIELRG